MILSRFGGDTGGFKSPGMSAKQNNVLFLRQVYSFRAYKRRYRSGNGVQNRVLIVHEVCSMYEVSV